MVNQELLSQTFETANIDGINDALSDEDGPLHPDALVAYAHEKGIE